MIDKQAINTNGFAPTVLITLAVFTLCLACCGRSNASEPIQPVPSATPTATVAPVLQPEPTHPTSICQGLSGAIELQVLVGPAAESMSLLAVGAIPFQAIGNSAPYSIKGGGPINYQETLSKEWGTYTVMMDLDTQLEGACTESNGDGMLHAILTMSGSQNVQVRSEGLNQDYPWQGSETREMNLPIQDEATAQGEGWMCVLHLD
jgi:hypothetical protein